MSIILRSRAAWPTRVHTTFGAEQSTLFAAPSACASLLQRHSPPASASRSRGKLTTVSMAMAIGQKQHGRTALQEADADGAFKRRDSVYRHFVKKGSEFEPEGGSVRSCKTGSCGQAAEGLS